MCITSQGKSIKLNVGSIRVMGRAAQGVRILNIERPDFVVGVDRIVAEEGEGGEETDARTDAAQGELAMEGGGA